MGAHVTRGPNDCPHVTETGSHRFEWVDAGFDHEFGTERVQGFDYCDCGADPNDHDAYGSSSDDYDDDPFDAGDPVLTYDDYMMERAR